MEPTNIVIYQSEDGNTKIETRLENETVWLTQEQMATLTQILDQDYFTVEYFDVRVQGTTTAKYYAGDYATEILSKSRGLYKPFTVSLIPVSKRRY